jgi:hypothetical protein
MGRAGIGAGSHGGYVGSFEEKEASRCGASAGGRYVNDDGHTRAEDGARHGAHGVDQASGCIENYEKSCGSFGIGAGESAIELPGGYRLDGVGEDYFFDYGLLGVGEGAEETATGHQDEKDSGETDETGVLASVVSHPFDRKKSKGWGTGDLFLFGGKNENVANLRQPNIGAATGLNRSYESAHGLRHDLLLQGPA